MEAAKLKTFENRTGEGVVSFLPWLTRKSNENHDPSRWFCHVMIGGERVFQFGCPCGTCGIVFRKVGDSANRVDDSEGVRLMGPLESVPSSRTLERLARPLQRGTYHAVVIEAVPTLIPPRAADDYFSTDAVRLFDSRSYPSDEPNDPRTSYYRIGDEVVSRGTSQRVAPYNALALSIAMPLHDPENLNRTRVEHWKDLARTGAQLTAFAIGIVDQQAPATENADENYPIEEHLVLTNCLLDGHHRIQAAAEMRLPIRILSMITDEFSLVKDRAAIEAILKSFPIRPVGEESNSFLERILKWSA